MGNFQTAINDQYEEGNTTELSISVDFKKPVVLQLKPLLYWTLQQIRQIYVPFRQRKSSPLLTRSEFLRFLRLSRIMSFNLYERMYKKYSLNVFQILSILVLTAYTSYTYKIHLLFNIFDLDASKGLQFKELILSFKSLIRGYCILTDQALPGNDRLQKFGQIMFSRADLNNDQCLQLAEVLNWFEGNVQGIYLFKRFQPTDVIGKEDYRIFNCFPAYTGPQIRLIYQRIQKQHKKIRLQTEDYELLTPSLYHKRQQKKIEKLLFNQSNEKTQKSPTKYFRMTHLTDSLKLQDFNQTKKVGFQFFTKREEKQNKKSQLFSVSQRIQFKETDHEKKSNLSVLNVLSNSTRKFINLNKKKTGNFFKKSQSSMASSFQYKNLSKQPQFKVIKTAHNFNRIANFEGSELLSLIRKKVLKKKIQSTIILKGRTITKKQIFDLRDYFETLSGGKKEILIEDFLESFNSEKYNHMKSVAASLFNFLDIDQNGRVTFRQLVKKLYSDLSSDQFEIIKQWNNEYNQSFNLQKKAKTNQESDDFKKRILPKTCATKYKQMFNFFDRQKKGFVDISDLKRILSDVSTEKELIDAFQENDKDNDGKLNLKQFLHIILPIDLEIEGI